MNNMASDLAFLKCLLTFIRNQESSVDEKFMDIIAVIYNQMGPVKYHNARAAKIAKEINPTLIVNIATSVMQMEKEHGKAYAIGVLEHKLIDAITDVTGQTIEELDKELDKARLISKLMTEGIHIDNTNNT